MKSEDKPSRPNDNEIRVTTMGKMRAYITYASKKLQDVNKCDEITLKAMGKAIHKTVIIAEIIKRRIPNLHQITQIDSTPIPESYQPKEEGLDPVQATRNVSSINITLYNRIPDTNALGYQAPQEYPQPSDKPRPSRPPRRRGPPRNRGGGRGYRGGNPRPRGGREGGSTSTTDTITVNNKPSNPPANAAENPGKDITADSQSNTTTAGSGGGIRRGGYSRRGGRGGGRRGGGRGRGSRGRGGYRGGYGKNASTTPPTAGSVDTGSGEAVSGSGGAVNQVRTITNPRET